MLSVNSCKLLSMLDLAYQQEALPTSSTIGMYARTKMRSVSGIKGQREAGSTTTVKAHY